VNVVEELRDHGLIAVRLRVRCEDDVLGGARFVVLLILPDVDPFLVQLLQVGGLHQVGDELLRREDRAWGGGLAALHRLLSDAAQLTHVLLVDRGSDLAFGGAWSELLGHRLAVTAN
jgi:hypothetical protein